MYALLYFLTNAFDLLGAFVICVYVTTPYVLIPIAVLSYSANLLRKYFLKTQREVTRFQQSTNSPVVSGLISTISGLSTIRAFKKESYFSEGQHNFYDVNKRVRLTKNGVKNWFANTLAYLCFMISMPCIAYCMFISEPDPAVMGLLMAYALTLTYNASRLILYQTDVETKLVSAERLYTFMAIQPEENSNNNWSPEEE